MLAHTSGLPDFYSLPEYAAKKRETVTLPGLVAWVKTKPLDFLPGSKSSYSNTGYAFLAYIIEQVSGKSYEQFLTDEILKPAGMKDTGTFRDETLVANRAAGYQPALDDRGLRNAPFYDKAILSGSGSLYSTTADLYEWCRAVQSGKYFDPREAARPMDGESAKPRAIINILSKVARSRLRLAGLVVPRGGPGGDCAGQSGGRRGKPNRRRTGRYCTGREPCSSAAANKNHHAHFPARGIRRTL